MEPRTDAPTGRPDPVDVPDAPWLEAAADVVTVSGPEAESYLQSQLSQEIRDLAVGGHRWTFVLEPTGKVDALARLTRTADDTFELRVDPGHGEVLLERIDRFKIRVKAETSLSSAPAPTPAELEHERILRGWPKMGGEIVPGDTIPAVTGVTPFAVDHRKGCYPGQELVERMDSRSATAPRSLRRFTVEAGAAPGDPVVADGAEVGELTSVSGTAALGYVKRGVEAGDPIDHG